MRRTKTFVTSQVAAIRVRPRTLFALVRSGHVGLSREKELKRQFSGKAWRVRRFKPTEGGGGSGRPRRRREHGLRSSQSGPPRNTNRPRGDPSAPPSRTLDSGLSRHRRPNRRESIQLGPNERAISLQHAQRQYLASTGLGFSRCSTTKPGAKKIGVPQDSAFGSRRHVHMYHIWQQEQYKAY